MASQISLRPKDWNPNTNSFRYTLSTSTTFEGYEVALYSLSLYNSFFNISSDYNNNSFQLTFNANFSNYTNTIDQLTPLTGTSYTFTINIPDGFYDISTLNYYILNECKKRKLYLKSTLNSTEMYFTQLIVNTTIYGNQINLALVEPTEGYDYPENAGWTCLSTPKTMGITLNAQLGKLYGFSANTYGNSTTNIQYVSNITPEINKIDNLSVCCNLVSNDFSQNNVNELTCVPFNVKFGALITYTDKVGLFTSIQKNIYTYIDIQFRDQNGDIIKLKDTQGVISLTFRRQR